MTTLQQAIEKIDRSAHNQGYPDLDHYCAALNMHSMGWHTEFEKRCTSYWVERWLCTDTMVGSAIVFVDNEPVALFVQTARRNTPHIRFIGEAGADKMRQLLVSIAPKGHYDLCELASRIPEFPGHEDYPQYAKQAL